jgi:isocitrate/isopropylmalate dehydrogenase
MKTYEIAAIPGDGIGVEVIAAGIEALEMLAKQDGGFKAGCVARGAGITQNATGTGLAPK